MEILDSWKSFAANMLLGGLSDAKAGLFEESIEFLSSERSDIFCSMAGIDVDDYKSVCCEVLAKRLVKEK